MINSVEVGLMNSEVFGVYYEVYNYPDETTEVIIICDGPRNGYTKLYKLRYERYIYTKGATRLDNK